MRKGNIFGLFLVLVPVLFAAMPLFGFSFIPTHDGEFNIIRFMDFFRMLESGHWVPRWAPTLNSGYGLPVFIFLYPLPNYVGSFLHLLGLDFVSAFKVGEALGYITASLLSFLWLARLFPAGAALTGSVIAAFVPYWFVDIYVRGTIGEIWAIAFMFAALYALEARGRALLAFAVAGLILSHNIQAMVFLPFLTGYGLLRRKDSVLWMVFGVMLAAYFWMPALYERQYVVGLNTVDFRDHFAQLYELLIPSWGTGFSASGVIGSKMSFQIGMIPLFVILVFPLFAVGRNRPERKLSLYMTGVFILACFLMLPVSRPVWEIVRFLQYAQHPWRFLSLIIPISAFAGSTIARRIRTPFIQFLPALLSVVITYPYYTPVRYEPRGDDYYLSRREFTDGTNSMGNSFSTVWTPWIRERAASPVFLASGAGDVQMTADTYTSKHGTVYSPYPVKVRLATLYYPGWRVSVNGAEAAVDYSSGVITFSVPAGSHSFKVWFADTPVRTASNAISVAAFLLLVGYTVVTQAKGTNRKPHAYENRD